jgi:hypothetical protein
MSNAYSEIIACADRVSQIVGPYSNGEPKLVISGRLPAMLDAVLSDLLPPSLSKQCDPAAQHRIAKILQHRSSALRGRLERQYSQMAAQYFSLSICGITDYDLETSLIAVFEERYRRFLDEIRAMLVHLLSRNICRADADRNTRGGFGDVSSPHITQANSSANPPNPRNSIQLHEIPTLNRN